MQFRPVPTGNQQLYSTWYMKAHPILSTLARSTDVKTLTGELAENEHIAYVVRNSRRRTQTESKRDTTKEPVITSTTGRLHQIAVPGGTILHGVHFFSLLI
jgi:hypothetical protein